MKTKSTLLTALPAITLLIALVPFVAGIGCKRKTVTDEVFFFTPINPVADSLMREYELITRGIVLQPDRVDDISSKLDSVAHATGNRQLKARSLIVKAYLCKKLGRRDSMLAALDSAIILTDSVKYPYDYASIIRRKGNYIATSFAETYRLLLTALDEFKEVNDSFSVSFVYNYFGAINEHFGDDEATVEMYNLARNWTPERYKFPRYILYFNTTLSLWRQGKTAEWYPRIDSLKQSEFSDAGDRINMFISIMSYEKSGNLYDLREAYQSACSPVAPDWGKPYIASMLAAHYLKTGNRDSMLHYVRIMRDNMNQKMGNYEDMLEVNIKVYAAENKNDSAAIAGKELAIIKYKNNQLQDALKLENEEQKKEFAEIDRTIAEEREREATWRRVIAVAAAIAVAACVWFIVAWQRRHHRRECMMLESTLEQKERRIAAAEMRASEKDRALAEIAGDVRDIKSDDPEVVARIMSTINVNRSGDADWEKFSLLFGEMHPDFADSLRREYPALTTGDVNLACMVFLGLETKHIARLLSINPDSVKKNRQRLRAKLGLTPDQPLDLFLRDYERNRRNCHR